MLGIGIDQARPRLIHEKSIARQQLAYFSLGPRIASSGMSACTLEDLAKSLDVRESIIQRGWSNSDHVWLPLIDHNSVLVQVFENGIKKPWPQTDAQLCSSFLGVSWTNDCEVVSLGIFPYSYK
jgi:hypothetical protein